MTILKQLYTHEIIRAKIDFDVIGHYARNDVFAFDVNGQPGMEKDE